MQGGWRFASLRSHNLQGPREASTANFGSTTAAACGMPYRPMVSVVLSHPLRPFAVNLGNNSHLSENGMVSISPGKDRFPLLRCIIISVILSKALPPHPHPVRLGVSLFRLLECLIPTLSAPIQRLLYGYEVAHYPRRAHQRTLRTGGLSPFVVRIPLIGSVEGELIHLHQG